MIQNEILVLKSLGRLSENIMSQFDELLQQIKCPISYCEAEILVTLFPDEHPYYGVDWSLLHIFETVSCKEDEYDKLIKMCSSEKHKDLLNIRWENAKASKNN